MREFVNWNCPINSVNNRLNYKFNTRKTEKNTLLRFSYHGL